jgi:hypothetical protein
MCRVSNANVFREKAESVVKLAKLTDNSAHLRALNSTQSCGLEVRVGNDSGNVDAIKSNMLKALPLCAMHVLVDHLNGGCELVVVLDLELEAERASARAKAMLASRVMKSGALMFVGLACVAQTLSTQRIHYIVPLISTAINSTMGKNYSRVFEEAVQAANETLSSL